MTMTPHHLLLVVSALLTLASCSPTPGDHFTGAKSASARAGAGVASAAAGRTAVLVGPRFAFARAGSARAGVFPSFASAGSASASAGGGAAASSASSAGASASASAGADDFYDYDYENSDYDYEPTPPALSFSIFDDTTARPPAPEQPPAPTLSPCTWAVVNCCSNPDRWGSRVQCFDQQGCTGAWFEDFCTPSVKRGVFQQVFGSIQG